MDKSRLTHQTLPEGEVPIPGVGEVRVRALSRVEVLIARKATDEEHMDGPRVLTLERKMLATALLDPVLTEAEVGQWQATAPAGQLQPVVAAVQSLSGMDDDAPKSGVPADGDEPGTGVRALPGAEAGDDGGPAPGGDG